MTDRGIEWLKSRLGEIQKQTDEYRTPNAYRDQEFARAYADSGCTQREIAEAHGCKRRVVGYRLIFGRFLEWCGTTGATLPLRTLTERRFRECWSETTGTGEEPRFAQVVPLLVDPWRTPDVAAKIAATYKKGQWFTAEEFSESEGIRLRTVKATLARMRSGKNGSCAIVDRLYKDTRQYAIGERLPVERKISLVRFSELVADLEDAVSGVESVVVGKTWVSTGPQLIECELAVLKKRLRKARQLIRDISRTAPGDVRSGQRGFSIL